MGISGEPQPVYSAICDECSEVYEDNSEGWSQFLDKDHLLAELSSDGWEVSDEDRVTCESCSIKQRAAAEESGVADLQTANTQSMKKGACGCGNTKYSPDHLPQDHAGWQPH